MFEITFNTRRMDNVIPGLEKFARILPKRMSQSATVTLKNSIQQEVQRRALMGGSGATKRAETPANWRVWTEKLSDTEYVTTVTNPSAEHALYLNEPRGSYPFKINLKELKDWMELKYTGHKGVKELAEQISSKGHITKTWEGFAETAMAKAVTRMSSRWGRLVDAEFDKIQI